MVNEGAEEKRLEGGSDRLSKPMGLFVGSGSFWCQFCQQKTWGEEDEIQQIGQIKIKMDRSGL